VFKVYLFKNVANLKKKEFQMTKNEYAYK